MKESAATGIDIFRTFDALNDVSQMAPAIKAVRETGTAVAEVALCYTGNLLDPMEDLYALGYYLNLAQEIVDAGAHILPLGMAFHATFNGPDLRGFFGSLEPKPWVLTRGFGDKALSQRHRSPWLCARAMASAREPTSIFLKRFRTWNLTVFSLMPSFDAMVRLL